MKPNAPATPEECAQRIIRSAITRAEQVRKATEKDLFATRVALGKARVELSQLRERIALARRSITNNNR